MKILRVTSLGYESGGADSGIALLKPIFKAMGHEVKILSSDLHPELPHFSDWEFEAIEKQPMLKKLAYRIFYPASYRALKRAIEEFRPDIVDIHTMRELSASVLFALKGCPAVLTIHGMEDFLPSLLLWSFPAEFFKDASFTRKSLTFEGWLHYAYHRFLGLPFYRLGFRNIDRFAVLSRYMESEVAKDGIRAECVMNGIPLFAPIPMDPKSALVCYAGRLEKAKGVDCLIRAMPEILKRVPGAALEIAGTGSYEENLRKLVGALGLQERVTFLGHRSLEELSKMYGRSAVAVVPSVWPEPFGKAGPEAMSAGRPVVASAVGGIPEWCADGKTGYLVPPGDSGALAEKVTALLTDTGLRERMGARAAEHAREFGIDAHARNMLAFYEKALKNHKNQA